jgi:hypothetical protein
MTESLRSVNPDCQWFHWIGQVITSCDQCGRPIWEHAGLPNRPENPFEDTPGGRPWSQDDRWNRMHQRWLEGWDIEVENDTIQLTRPVPAPPQPEPTPVEDIGVEVSSWLNIAAILHVLTANLDEDQMVEVMKLLDVEMSSWSFTEQVHAYFQAEMKKFGE